MSGFVFLVRLRRQRHKRRPQCFQRFRSRRHRLESNRRRQHHHPRRRRQSGWRSRARAAKARNAAARGASPRGARYTCQGYAGSGFSAGGNPGRDPQPNGSPETSPSHRPSEGKLPRVDPKRMACNPGVPGGLRPAAVLSTPTRGVNETQCRRHGCAASPNRAAALDPPRVAPSVAPCLHALSNNVAADAAAVPTRPGFPATSPHPDLIPATSPPPATRASPR